MNRRKGAPWQVSWGRGGPVKAGGYPLNRVSRSYGLQDRNANAHKTGSNRRPAMAGAGVMAV